MTEISLKLVRFLAILFSGFSLSLSGLERFSSISLFKSFEKGFLMLVLMSELFLLEMLLLLIRMLLFLLKLLISFILTISKQSMIGARVFVRKMRISSIGMWTTTKFRQELCKKGR